MGRKNKLDMSNLRRGYGNTMIKYFFRVWSPTFVCFTILPPPPKKRHSDDIVKWPQNQRSQFARSRDPPLWAPLAASQSPSSCSLGAGLGGTTRKLKGRTSEFFEEKKYGNIATENHVDVHDRIKHTHMKARKKKLRKAVEWEAVEKEVKKSGLALYKKKR